MDKVMKKSLNKKLKLPFIVILIGVLILIAGMFLPYMTAVGELAEYIEKHPDSIEIAEFDITAGDLKDVPMVLMGMIAASAYNTEEGILFSAIIIAFAFFAALTALFAALRKPIAVIIAELLSCGTFAFLDFGSNADFYGIDMYARGSGYYVIATGFVIVFAGAIWMLVKKIVTKKKLKAERAVQTEI